MNRARIEFWMNDGGLLVLHEAWDQEGGMTEGGFDPSSDAGLRILSSYASRSGHPLAAVMEYSSSRLASINVYRVGQTALEGESPE